MTDWIINKLTCWDPEGRRRAAVQMLVWSLVAMVINVGLYLGSVITETHLILITLILSWLAITLTAADIIVGTDVRAEVEE